MRTPAWLLVMACWLPHALPAQPGPVGSAFTYQGQLLDQGQPANGSYDLSFGLFLDPTGVQQSGSTLSLENVAVAGGTFTVELDFGFGAFDGDQLWMQVGVRPGASIDPHLLLSPRQKLTATPYAVQAQFVAQGSVGAAQIDPAQVQRRVAASCAPGATIRAVNLDGSVACEPDDSVDTCYIRWGGVGCAAGFNEVVNGRTGGLEHFSSAGGVAAPSLECVSATAAATQSFSGYFNRLFRGDAQGDGMDEVSGTCSVCCRGGCYTAWGTSTCAPGYSATYVGRAGGVEAYQSGHRAQGQCIDAAAAATATFGTGYSTRLIRHRPPLAGSANGMDVIGNACAVCCRD